MSTQFQSILFLLILSVVTSLSSCVDNKEGYAERIVHQLHNDGINTEKYTQCLAICETRTREGGEVSAFTPLLSCKFVFANAVAVSTTIVTKPQTYQPNIKVMFNQVNQH